MARKIAVVVSLLFVIIGCARVQVVAPKDPIKVDISMRLDVYQHVEKDINAIEDIVSGKVPLKPQSRIGGFVSVAYASEGLSPEVEQAALRRQGRYEMLTAAQANGSIGENNGGFVEVRGAGSGGLAELVTAENNDRMLIYRTLADKNGASLDDVKKIYAQKLQDSAPSGTPVQSPSGQWQVK